MNWLASSLVCSFASTTVMTLFSVFMSQLAHRDYVEPHLLTRLFVAQIPNAKIGHSPLGWTTHFAVGWLFVTVYNLLWYFKLVDYSWASGLMLGLLSGIIGIIGWRLLRKLAP